jgi:hypothetical protein
MTMDALELLDRLGRVDPADRAVVDAALQRLAEAAGRDGHQDRRARARHRGLIAAAAATAALTSAAAYIGVSALDHSGPVDRPGASSATHARTSPGSPARASAVAAMLTAFSARSNDILMVTKTMSGSYGTLGKTVMWVSPAMPGPGTTVTSRILTFSLAGSRLGDLAFTYTAPAKPASAGTSGCGEIFSRPRIAHSDANGTPGTATIVLYPQHLYVKADAAVRSATVPSAAGLRSCLASGQWRVLDHSTLDGVRVVELVTPAGFERLWVSAASFLPMRLVSSGPDADTITFSFGFLPPTTANLAMLNAAIPAGFKRESF